MRWFTPRERFIQTRSSAVADRRRDASCHWIFCTDCQQGGLLQLGSRWYHRPVARTAAVRLECRRPFGFLSEAVRTHNPIASWTPLVESSGASHIPAVRSVLAYRCLHETAPAYLAESLHRTSDVDIRRRRRSADSAMLVVPSTRRSTLGDRAFPVTSARAWNSLPSSVRNAPSLTTFRRELMTVLFRSSFDNDYRRSWLYCTVLLLSARDYWLSAILSFCLFFLFFLILYGAPAMSLTW